MSENCEGGCECGVTEAECNLDALFGTTEGGDRWSEEGVI